MELLWGLCLRAAEQRGFGGQELGEKWGRKGEKGVRKGKKGVRKGDGGEMSGLER